MSRDGSDTSSARSEASVALYWLPLGAGGHSVRLNGRVYEALVARLEGRQVCDLYHSALEVCVPEGRYVIEQTPIPPDGGADRGVVGEGAVGSGWAGRMRIFRYEVHRWRDGDIPDAAEAVESPRRLTGDPRTARRLLALAPYVPMPVWGRDELHTGEMWNSNSVIAWLIASSGLETDAIQPPTGGRAPGWNAGLTIARRQACAVARRPASGSSRSTSSSLRTGSSSTTRLVTSSPIHCDAVRRASNAT